MQKSRDLKPHFEAILGRELEIDSNGEVTLRERVATYDTQSEEKGRVTSRDIGTTGAFSKGCSPRKILDVSGVGRTGADGKVEFLLNDFHCETPLDIQYPVNFVATPRSTSPVFLTSLRSVLPDGKDLKITVSAWDPTGAPAGNTPFDWRCRVPYEPVAVVD